MQDKKDFILKNYSRVLLVFIASWIISFFAGSFILIKIAKVAEGVPLTSSMLFLGAGIGMILLSSTRPKEVSLILAAGGVLMGLLGLLTMVEYEFAINFIKPSDNNVWFNISFGAMLPISLGLFELNRQTRIFERLTPKLGDILTLKRGLREDPYLFILDDKGIYAVTDKSKILFNAPASDFVMKKEGFEDFAIKELGYKKPNTPRTPDGVIMSGMALMQAFLDWYHGDDTPPPPRG